MEICDELHPEIVYDGKSCPFCDYIVDINQKISDLEIVIAKLEDSE